MNITSALLSHITLLLSPYNYLLFLTCLLLLFIAHLIVPRGVRAEFCGVGRRKRYRRQHQRPGGRANSSPLRTNSNSKRTSTPAAPLMTSMFHMRTTVVPQDVLENIYAHSHSFSNEFTSPAPATTANANSTASKSYHTPSPYYHSNKSSEASTGRSSRGSHCEDYFTPRLGMARPPTAWNKSAIQSTSPLTPTTALNDGGHQQQEKQQLVLQHELQKLFSHPPGIRLIAHGTKCNPRPVWITLHYFDNTTNNGGIVRGGGAIPPLQYRNCLTWRAELRPSSTTNSPNSPKARNINNYFNTPTSITSPSTAATQQPQLGNLRRVNLTDILDMELGKRTIALRRLQTARKVKEEDCFSLLTRSGTLDLQCVELHHVSSSSSSSLGGGLGGLGSNAAGGGGQEAATVVVASAEQVRNALLSCLSMALSANGVTLNGLHNGVGASSSASRSTTAAPSVSSSVGGSNTTHGNNYYMTPMMRSRGGMAHPNASNSTKNSTTDVSNTTNTSTSRGTGNASHGIGSTTPSEAGTTMTGLTNGSKTISTMSF